MSSVNANKPLGEQIRNLKAAEKNIQAKQTKKREGLIKELLKRNPEIKKNFPTMQANKFIDHIMRKNLNCM